MQTLLNTSIQTDVDSWLRKSIAAGLNDTPVIPKLSFRDWLSEFYFLKDGAFSLAGYEPLEKLYADESQEIIYMKSAQCGVSEMLVAFSFYFPMTFRENVFYAMPAKDQISDFVQGRVDPRVDDSVRLQKFISKTDNIGLKQVGLNYIYYRGSQNRRQIITVDAGLLIIDEFDEVVQDHIPVMEKRLGNSKYKLKRKAGVPSYFETGIHAEYLQSDQMEYHFKCGKCGKNQVPDWSKNISPAPTRDRGVDIPAKVDLVCLDCGAVLDRSQMGEWIAGNPGAMKRGYHISKLMFASTDLRALWIEYQNTRNLRDFFNSNLGVPFAAEGGKLDDSMLLACCEDFKIEKPTGCDMGVDVGGLLHVRINQIKDDKKYAVFIGAVKDFEELDSLMKRFDVSRCVIDGLPETRKAKEFAERFPGRVYLAYYSIDDPNKTYEAKKGDRPLRVNINRVRAMDETGNEFIERRKVLPINAREIPDYFDQLKAPQRVKEVNKDGNDVYRYIEGNKADHYYHADVYADIAGRLKSKIDISFI